MASLFCRLCRCKRRRIHQRFRSYIQNRRSKITTRRIAKEKNNSGKGIKSAKSSTSPLTFNSHFSTALTFPFPLPQSVNNRSKTLTVSLTIIFRPFYRDKHQSLTALTSPTTTPVKKIYIMQNFRFASLKLQKFFKFLLKPKKHPQKTPPYLFRQLFGQAETFSKTVPIF